MGDDSLLNLGQIQGNDTGNQLYQSEEQLLDDILNSKDVKHSKHLRYLSLKHDSATLKIRFVLSPFSFAFLINGKLIKTFARVLFDIYQQENKK